MEALTGELTQMSRSLNNEYFNGSSVKEFFCFQVYNTPEIQANLLTLSCSHSNDPIANIHTQATRML